MAPSALNNARDRAPPAGTLADAGGSGALYSLWETKRKVDGVRKHWKTSKRLGIDIAPDQKARVMRSLGMRRGLRPRREKAIPPYPTETRQPDLVRRDFVATPPNQLWVTRFTFVQAGQAWPTCVCSLMFALETSLAGGSRRT